MRIYNELDELTNQNFTLFQSYPMCIWDPQFIKLLDSKKSNNKCLPTPKEKWINFRY